MIKMNSDGRAALLLFMENLNGYTAALDGYPLHHVAHHDEAEKLIVENTCDAVIADNAPETVRLYEHIRSAMSYPCRPLLLVVSENPLDPCPAPADGLITAAHLKPQFESYLRLHKEMQAACQQREALHAEIERLRQELNTERRLRNEIEVLKNAIVRNVSHELKTPLLQVKSAVSLIAEDVTDEKLVEYATGATARLENVVRNITMLGGSLETNLGPVIVRDALEYARRNLRRVWEHREHVDRVHTDLPNDLPPVLADKQGLSTVFQLLIDNALKFSKENVEVYARVEADKLQIGVKDYGIGIEPDKLDTIFESFYQVDHSSTRRYGGAGVGLAIVRLILDAHHTQIQVESTVGQGSSFTFPLPIINL